MLQSLQVFEVTMKRLLWWEEGLSMVLKQDQKGQGHVRT